VGLNPVSKKKKYIYMVDVGMKKVYPANEKVYLGQLKQAIYSSASPGEM
jgi:hypothetical protein